MPAHKTVTHSPVSHAKSTSTERSAMPAHKTVTHSPVSHAKSTSTERSAMPTENTVPEAEATTTSSSVEVTATPAVQPHPSPLPVAIAATPPATVSAATALAAMAYLTPPPKNALIPPVPSNFVPESGADYRGITPKKAELVTLPLAVDDLRKFTNYGLVVGATAPPYDEILSTFAVTNEWSSMRTASSAWDVYGQAQEGICWTVMRAAMASLKPSFALAAQRDPSLPAKYPGLAALLGVKKAIAHKAVSTKRANKKAVAEGKEPTHGKVGKKRQKSADKAIVAAANAAASAPTASSTAAAPSATAPTAQPPAAATSTGPVASPVVATPTNGAAVVQATPANGVVLAANGAGH